MFDFCYQFLYLAGLVITYILCSDRIHSDRRNSFFIDSSNCKGSSECRFINRRLQNMNIESWLHLPLFFLSPFLLSQLGFLLWVAVTCYSTYIFLHLTMKHGHQIINISFRMDWLDLLAFQGTLKGLHFFFAQGTWFLGASKITADGDYSHEIKRHLILGSKVMINLDIILKSTDISLPTKAVVFTVVMYGCESWTIRKTALKSWGFLTLVFEKTLESPLDSFH